MKKTREKLHSGIRDGYRFLIAGLPMVILGAIDCLLFGCSRDDFVLSLYTAIKILSIGLAMTLLGIFCAYREEKFGLSIIALGLTFEIFGGLFTFIFLCIQGVMLLKSPQTAVYGGALLLFLLSYSLAIIWCLYTLGR